MENEIQIFNQENSTKTMTSKEIAELTNKLHKNIIQDIKNLIEKGAIGELNFQLSSYKSEQNKELPMYKLDFKATMTLITGYDAKRRSLIINRWIALETGEETPIVKMMKIKPDTISDNYKESETVIRTTLKIGKLLGTAEPMAKAIAVEEARRITGIDHSRLLPLADIKEIPVGIRDLAKKLNIKENKLKDILSREGLMTRADDENKTILLTEKAKSLKMGTLEPFQSKSSNHVGYQSKWFPSIIKEFIESKYQEAA